jgi:photosystem II stability/assembly factor-like uncharacterized protein
MIQSGTSPMTASVSAFRTILNCFSALSRQNSHFLSSHSGVVLATAILLLTGAEQARSQWQLMSDFYGTTFAGLHCVARNAERIVAVHINHTMYESDSDSIYWRELAVLPTAVAQDSGISGVFLSPGNEIYVLTRKNLYKLDEGTKELYCLTRNLQLPGNRRHIDLAVDKYGSLIITSGSSRFGSIYRSTNHGASWEYIDKYRLSAWDNPAQFSEEGTLFLNTWDGLLRSYNLGTSAESVGPFFTVWFQPLLGSNNAVIVVNDTTIYGSTDAGEIYSYRNYTNEWVLLRDEHFHMEMWPTMGRGDDGTFFLIYHSNETRRKAIEWSTDNGTTWRRRDVVSGELGQSIAGVNVFFGDSRRVVTYEAHAVGSEIFEFLLEEQTVYHRAKPIAGSYASYMTGNSTTLHIYGNNYEYHYDKRTSGVFLQLSNPLEYNRILVDGGSQYNLLNRWNRGSDGRLFAVNLAKLEDRRAAYRILPCAFVQFVFTRDRDIIGVNPKNRTYRFDSSCTWGPNAPVVVSDLHADLISINKNDHVLLALERGGEFECSTADGMLISMGRLEPYVDSIGWIQNDSRGNFVFLGKNTAYVSNDYGATWARSVVESNGALMSKVLADDKDFFYLLDYSSGVYWSADGGRSFNALPLPFDSLICSITDIYQDGEYLYCSTSGCGVYRMTLPSLNGLDTPRPVAQVHAPINLYSGNRRHVSIDVPFGLDGATLFRMTDLGGRVIYEAQYTVDIPRARITLDTESLSNGVYPFMISSLKEAVSGKLMIQK